MLKIVLIIGIVGLLWWLVRLIVAPTRTQTVQTELPSELQSSKLWGKEKPFSCTGSVNLTGRIDEAFELPDGDIVVSDTKSRATQRVYKSDILQVSAYKVVIEASTRKRVRDHGYIRLLTPQGNEYRRIELLSANEVAAAYQLHDDLQQGRYPGEKCGRPAVCRGCAYRVECESMD